MGVCPWTICLFPVLSQDIAMNQLDSQVLTELISKLTYVSGGSDDRMPEIRPV
jgi:hypothetical protein